MLSVLSSSGRFSCVTRPSECSDEMTLLMFFLPAKSLVSNNSNSICPNARAAFRYAEMFSCTRDRARQHIPIRHRRTAFGVSHDRRRPCEHGDGPGWRPGERSVAVAVQVTRTRRANGILDLLIFLMQPGSSTRMTLAIEPRVSRLAWGGARW